MGKIVCDICGTSYPDTADQCPICGCSRDVAAQMLDDEFMMEEKEEKTVKSGLFSSKKRKEIFDFDEVNNGAAEPEEFDGDEDQYDEDEEEEQEEDRPNTFLVILLTILIVILLLAAGILFIRYIRPNMNKDPQDVPTVPTVESISQPMIVGIPCETLVLSSGNEVKLTGEGGMFLLHVNKIPSDSTDEIIYTSADERVATVTSDGRIEAVSEGETTITITCGDKSITATVVVDYSAATEPETEPPVVTPPADPTPVQDPVAPAITNPVPDKTYRTDVVLKLKQSDFILPIGYYHTLLLDCDLDPSEVEWSTEHSYVATVDETGKVTAVGFGVTDVIVKYGDQEAHCTVRCGY